jgi:hypothetical protein
VCEDRVIVSLFQLTHRLSIQLDIRIVYGQLEICKIDVSETLQHRVSR